MILAERGLEIVDVIRRSLRLEKRTPARAVITAEEVAPLAAWYHGVLPSHLKGTLSGVKRQILDGRLSLFGTPVLVEFV